MDWKEAQKFIDENWMTLEDCIGVVRAMAIFMGGDLDVIDKFKEIATDISMRLDERANNEAE